MVKWTRRDAVCATVAYADIFDYPLTEQSLWLWLLYYKKNTRASIPVSTRIQQKQAGTELYYVVYGRTRIISIFQKRQRAAVKKWEFVREVSRWFRFIPTITLVGVTGGLAMHNTKKDDDIDLFFITKSGTLWITRLLATILAELLGVRRRPGDARFSNKLCLNMFMAEDSLALAKGERDVFAAHEVLQMAPLWERGEVYRKFLKANKWVRVFLPNAWKERYQGIGIKYYGKKQRAFTTLIPNTSTRFLRLFEPVVKYVQLLYMRRRRTTEVVSASIIRFHPTDARVWVREALEKRLVRYNIPLDKVFYAR